MKTFLPVLALLFILAATPHNAFTQEKLQQNPEETKAIAPTRLFKQAFSTDTSPLLSQPSANPGAASFSQQFISTKSAAPLSIGSATKNQSPVAQQATQPAGEVRLSLQENAPQTSLEAAVVACDEAPIGTDDNYLTSTDKTLTIAAPGFLANDIDLQGEALTATVILESPMHGALSAFADGSFTYIPNAGYTGSDQFQYRMKDASNNPGEAITVIIEVIDKVNRNPIGTNDRYAAVANTSLSIPSPGFLSNDIDPDGEAITATVILESPIHGTISAFGDGSFTYTPEVGYTGPDQFQYRMRDASNNLSEPVTVNLQVVEGNRSPIGVEDLYGVVQNTNRTIAAAGFLANDFDPDGEAITATVILESPMHGTISAFGDGSFTYTPNAGYTGSDQFQYRMRDASNNLSEPITVTLQVIETGTLPVGFEDHYYTSNDQPISQAAPGFLANDIDQDGEALTTTAILDNVDHGTLSAFADGSFIYTPDANFTGTDQFQYRMRDASNNLSEPITVYIEVAGSANRPPLGTDDTYALLTNTTLSVSAAGFLSNDIDPDGESITASVILESPENGTISAFADGSFSYTPNPDFEGIDQFQYRMRDASNNLSEPVTVTLEVYQGNRPPISVNDVYAVVKNTPLSLAASGFLSNDFDPDGEEITATVILESPVHGTLSAFANGSFTYSPNPDFVGSDQFLYRMGDASGNLSEPTMVSLNVIGPNQAPVALAADVTAECQDTAGTTVTLDGSGSRDPEENQLTYSWYDNGTLLAGPTNSPTSEIVLTNGTYQLTLMVEDECGKTDTDVANITVEDTTDPSVSAAFVTTAQPYDYQISCQASDICSDNVSSSSVIKLPDLSSPGLKLKNQNKYSLEVDLKKNEVTVSAPDASAFWTMIQSLGGVSVNDGQIIEAKYDKNKYKYKFDDAGNLESVSGEVVTLLCRAEDGNGNLATAEATLPMNLQASVSARALASDGNEALDAPLSYPNPFSSQTTIRYQLNSAGAIKISVYEQSGRLLDVLFDGERDKGTYEVQWDGTAYQEGIYIYQIQQGNELYHGKMLLMRNR